MRGTYLLKSYFFIFLAALSTVGTAGAQDQPYDYESRPRLDFKFLDATIDVQLDPDTVAIEGSANYRVEANVSTADTLLLQAVQLQIDSVLTQGAEAGFTHENGILKIAVTDSAVIGQQYQVQVFYHGVPEFGLLKSSEGSIWTSQLPRSTRHWVPSPDHPAVSLINTLSLTVPNQYTVTATGVKTDEEVDANGHKKWTFRTGQPVSVSAINFAIGHFNEEGISYGIKRINSYAEPLAIESDRQRELAQEAQHVIRQVENATGMEYPYQRLHLVILNDHYWETKPYGASTIFLYKNRGDWLNQLRRGIYAQWFGIYQREGEWSESWPVQLFQTALHFKISNAPALLETTEEPETNYTTVYDQFDVEHWNWWQEYESWNLANVREMARRIIPDVLQMGSGVFTPDMYENIWYQLSGQPSIRIPDHKFGNNTPAVSDSIVYRVDYEIQSAQQLQLVFTAQQGVIETPVEMSVEVIGSSPKATLPIRFAGESDTVAIDLPAGTQNVFLSLSGNKALILEEHKPVPFLLYQLRNAETIEAKKKAALQIGYHSQNPDLQLALNDVMDEPMEPEVEAALLRSFGAITNGATGTEARFVNALNSDSPLVQAAALDVLQNYPNNERVTQRIRELSRSEVKGEVGGKALDAFMQRIDSTKALQYTNTLVQQDTAGTKAIAAIGQLAQRGNTETAINLAKFYIAPVYSYSVRREAFDVLLSYDTSAEAWGERLTMLLRDHDPRIRFLGVQNLGRIPGIDPGSVLQEHLSSEYDARVVKAVE